jgi:hypothetical protein
MLLLLLDEGPAPLMLLMDEGKDADIIDVRDSDREIRYSM